MAETIEHGTHNAYVHHCHDGYKGGPCDKCRAAHAEYRRQLRQHQLMIAARVRVKDLITKHKLVPTQAVKDALLEAVLMRKII